MNINLHIERLVLDGLPVETGQAALVKQAVEAELTRLLQVEGFSGPLKSGGALPSLRANSIQLSADKNPAAMGQQIAEAVYRGVAK